MDSVSTLDHRGPFRQSGPAGMSHDGARRADAAPDGARDHAGPRALFVQKGVFSGSNAGLLAGLRQVRPDLRIDVLDIRDALSRPLLPSMRLMARSLLEPGLPGVVWSRNPRGGFGLREHFRNRFIRSHGAFDAIRDIVRARVAEGRYAFTIQTQSLFDASVPGTPQFVYTDHAALARGGGAPVPPAGGGWLAREGQIYENATHVFTFGPHVRSVIVERYGVPPEKVTAVGSGTQASVAAAVDTRVDRYRRRRVLFVGRAWERKGGPELLAAFRIVRRSVPDAELVVVGTSAPQDEPGVTVLGPLPREAVARQFAEASLFCMPSRLEPFGIVIAEAMQHGLPVVSTRVGEMSSMVEQEVSGLLVPPSAPEALAEALVRLLRDPELSAAFARRGMRRAEAFTWPTVAEKMARHFPVGDL